MQLMKQIAQARLSPSELEAPSFAPPHNILVIDDNAILGEAIEITLTRAGHQAALATSAAAAFDLMWKLKPDLVITDVILPDLDSLDLIGELKRIHQDLKIIAISGNPHLLRLAANNGANHTLAKPFDLGKLQVLIDVAMN